MQAVSLFRRVQQLQPCVARQRCECALDARHHREIRFSQGAEWNAAIRRYIAVMPPSGDITCADGQSMSIESAPVVPVHNAINRKVGVAARCNPSIEAIDTLPLRAHALWWSMSVIAIDGCLVHFSRSGCRRCRRGRTCRDDATRHPFHCVRAARDRATGTCPTGRRVRARRSNRCGRPRRHRARKH